MASSVATAAAVVRGTRGEYRWSLAEYYRLGEAGLFRDRRTELLKGSLIIMPLPDEPHNAHVMKVADLFKHLFGPEYQVREEKAFVIAPDSDVGPDVAVVRRNASSTLVKPGRAELIVEIAFSTLDYDLMEKADLYASAGVPEYWVLAPLAKQLHIHRNPMRTGDVARYASVTTISAPGTCDVIALPGVQIAIADLLV